MSGDPITASPGVPENIPLVDKAADKPKTRASSIVSAISGHGRGSVSLAGFGGAFGNVALLSSVGSIQEDVDDEANRIRVHKQMERRRKEYDIDDDSDLSYYSASEPEVVTDDDEEVKDDKKWDDKMSQREKDKHGAPLRKRREEILKFISLPECTIFENSPFPIWLTDLQLDEMQGKGASVSGIKQVVDTLERQGVRLNRTEELISLVTERGPMHKKDETNYFIELGIQKKKEIEDRRLRVIDDNMFFLAIVSILLTIVYMELGYDRANDTYDGQKMVVLVFKFIVTGITAGILFLLVTSYAYKIRLDQFYSSSGINQQAWRSPRVPAMFAELFLVSLHTLPFFDEFDPDDSLNVLVFCRLILVFRVIRNRSYVYKQRYAVLRNVSKIFRNSISFTPTLSLRIMFDMKPMRVFIFCLIISLTVLSYMVYITGRLAGLTQAKDAIYFVCISIVRTGYGDIVPLSKWAKFVAVLIGFIGLFLQALLFAGLGSWLELKTHERLYADRVISKKYDIEEQNIAASLIQAAFRRYSLNKFGQTSGGVDSYHKQDYTHLYAWVKAAHRWKTKRGNLMKTLDSRNSRLTALSSNVTGVGRQAAIVQTQMSNLIIGVVPEIRVLQKKNRRLKGMVTKLKEEANEKKMYEQLYVKREIETTEDLLPDDAPVEPLDEPLPPPAKPPIKKGPLTIFEKEQNLYFTKLDPSKINDQLQIGWHYSDKDWQMANKRLKVQKNFRRLNRDYQVMLRIAADDEAVRINNLQTILSVISMILAVLSLELGWDGEEFENNSTVNFFKIVLSFITTIMMWNLLRFVHMTVSMEASRFGQHGDDVHLKVQHSQSFYKFLAEAIIISVHAPPFCESFLPDEINAFVFLRAYLFLSFFRDHTEMFKMREEILKTPEINPALISFSIPFFLKVAFLQAPWKCLTVITTFFVAVFTYMMYVFERDSQEELDSFVNNLYLVVITMMSVGYGDIYPITQLGRVLAVVISVIGVVLATMLMSSFHRSFDLNQVQRTVLRVVHETSYHERKKEFAVRWIQAWWRQKQYQRKLADPNVDNSTLVEPEGGVSGLKVVKLKFKSGAGGVDDDLGIFSPFVFTQRILERISDQLTTQSTMLAYATRGILRHMAGRKDNAYITAYGPSTLMNVEYELHPEPQLKHMEEELGIRNPEAVIERSKSLKKKQQLAILQNKSMNEMPIPSPHYGLKTSKPFASETIMLKNRGNGVKHAVGKRSKDGGFIVLNKEHPNKVARRLLKQSENKLKSAEDKIAALESRLLKLMAKRDATSKQQMQMMQHNQALVKQHQKVLKAKNALKGENNFLRKRMEQMVMSAAHSLQGKNNKLEAELNAHNSVLLAEKAKLTELKQQALDDVREIQEKMVKDELEFKGQIRDLDGQLVDQKTEYEGQLAKMRSNNAAEMLQYKRSREEYTHGLENQVATLTQQLRDQIKYSQDCREALQKSESEQQTQQVAASKAQQQLREQVKYSLAKRLELQQMQAQMRAVQQEIKALRNDQRERIPREGVAIYYNGLRSNAVPVIKALRNSQLRIQHGSKLLAIVEQRITNIIGAKISGSPADSLGAVLSSVVKARETLKTEPEIVAKKSVKLEKLIGRDPSNPGADGNPTLSESIKSPTGKAWATSTKGEGVEGEERTEADSLLGNDSRSDDVGHSSRSSSTKSNRGGKDYGVDDRMDFFEVF